MSDSSPVHKSRDKRSVFYDVLAAVIVGLIGLAILETSRSSVVFGSILNVDYRMPVAPVVYLGAVLFGVVFFLIDRAHSFSGWFTLSRRKVTRTTLGRYDWIITVACLSVLVVLIWHSFGAPIDRKLTDYFHEGEILASFTIIQHAADVPILIHGPGRNLLPAWLAVHFAQPGHEIAFMRFVTGIGAMMTLLMVAVTTYVFAFALLEGVSPNSRRLSISVIASLLASLVAIKEADISNRHVLFLSALALAAIIIYTADRKKGQALMLSAIFGGVCALAPIYVYAAGMATFAIAVITATILLLRDGLSAFRLVGTALGAFSACIILIFGLGGGELYFNAIRDILWWATEALGIWSLPLSGYGAIIHTAVLVATIALAGYLAFYCARSKDPGERRNSALLALLAFAVAIAARDMLERSDGAHTSFSMLTVAIGIGALAAPLVLNLSVRSLVMLAALGLGIVLVISEGDPRRIAWKIYSEIYSGDRAPKLAQLNTPDDSILSDDIRAFSRRYAAKLKNADCLLVLTNEGVLNYAANLPPCGDFFYPVYASVPMGDRKLFDWLHANPQQIAVIETDFWSGKIDGKPMSSRLPQVWTLVEETMPAREMIGSRTIAVRR